MKYISKSEKKLAVDIITLVVDQVQLEHPIDPRLQAISAITILDCAIASILCNYTEDIESTEKFLDIAYADIKHLIRYGITQPVKDEIERE
jgi:hypothetical protein